jgi:hypothetical protein
MLEVLLGEGVEIWSESLAEYCEGVSGHVCGLVKLMGVVRGDDDEVWKSM